MGKPHGNSRLAKIGIPVLKRKGKAGAPAGNRNARRHGGFSADAKARNEQIRALVQETEELIVHIDRLASLGLRLEADASVPPVTQK